MSRDHKRHVQMLATRRDAKPLLPLVDYPSRSRRCPLPGSVKARRLGFNDA